ncbi:MAG: histidinol-phosphate transaminase [Gammaproteobacteria bacterium]|nr:histidinol-phosphate transaminase [Gammaproteobacteria bacterium]
MKKVNLSNLHIETLEPYMSARRIGGSGEVWLNANELPFPRNSFNLDVSEFHRYPDQGPELVEATYATYAGVKADQTLVLRGADEAIDLLMRAYCQSGTDGIVINSPTYGMYRVSAGIQNALVTDVPLTENYQLNVNGITAQNQAKLIFICNPNNPSGNHLQQQDILEIVSHFEGKALVAIDEAYIEFCPEQSLVPELKNFSNLVVIRTMSKAFGLAGVHVGYLLANAEIMSVMRKVVAPYPLADPCAQIALQALEINNLELMQQQVKEINLIRDAFCETVADFPAVTNILPSVANFVLVSFTDKENAWLALVEAGIVARQIPHPRLTDFIRFSIGTPTEMEQVISVLERLV